MVTLTQAERDFLDCYYHEIIDHTSGPATKWYRSLGIMPIELSNFWIIRQRELTQAGLNEVSHAEMAHPWTSIDEFRIRSLEVKREAEKELDKSRD